MEAFPGAGGDGIVKDMFNNILIIQTAFIGDAILTLPLIQVLKKNYPNSKIDVVVVPRTAEIFANHPAISEIIAYDKRGKDKGFKGLFRLRNRLRDKSYELIVIPHRSLRSAFLGRILKPRVCIGFNRSTGRFLLTKAVKYNPAIHEIERNLSLLDPLSIQVYDNELPRLYPSENDVVVIDSLMDSYSLDRDKKIISIAPGTIWNTKRWPMERFIELCKLLSPECSAIMLIGGKEDVDLCDKIASGTKEKNIFNTAGKLSLLQSAELIRRSRVLVSNDSAPMHIAVAVGTPVVAIFGATVPEFGFAPRGKNDIVIETKGLKCRPCSIHGGDKCPIKTFECMLAIKPEMVLNKVRSFL
ncbi:MAG: lipopolysaccharide heptosyltransferase II [Bacteroidetes bacterium]|nr:lipopolysaccharide heptosyltransferase II [Bacteroidota bacterium]